MKTSNETKGLAAIIAAIAFAAVFLGIFSDWSLSRANSIVAAAQGFATVAAIGLAGLFAYQKLGVFRTFYPHLTVSQDVVHRRVGDLHTHIFVTVTLHNGSKVEVRIREADFILQQVAPITDDDIEALYSEVVSGEERYYIQWPTLRGDTRAWVENELVIEPGGSHSEPFEFVVSKDVEAVLISTYFYNPIYSNLSKSSPGWGATNVYDIIEE